VLPLPILWFRIANLFFCITLVIGLFFSLPVISISVIALSCLWLLEPGLVDRIKALSRNKVSLLVLAFYAMHVLGLLWTNDMSYGMDDLRIKLPLLAMPIILGTGCKLEQREVKWVWWFFLASAITAAAISVTYGIVNDLTDKRDWSPFISHIRLSLLTILAFFVALINAKSYRTHSLQWLIFVVTALLLLGFLFVLNAFSGIIALIPAAIYWAYHEWYVAKTGKGMKVLASTVLVLLLGLMGYATVIAADFYSIKDVHWKEADQFSEAGERYHFEWGNPIKENGYYVKYYLTQDELAKSWSERSNQLLFTETGQATPILETVHRYMASKGLRKDSAGVSQLTDQDIEAIENGVTNYLFLKKGPFFKRTYATIWEIDHYVLGFGASGGSLTQRFEYWKTAWDIITDNFWMGVGTGDVQQAFDLKYEETNNLEEAFRLRAHNQYLTIWLTFGIGGLVLFLCLLGAPFFQYEKAKSSAFILFWLISTISMVNEDTLETQVGVTFFAFFFFFLLNQGVGINQESNR